MSDQARNCQSDNGPAGDHVERRTADAVPGAACQISSLPDPCSSAQLAEVLGKSPKTLVDWCQEREFTHIPCFRLGNRWYHRLPELIRWLNEIEGGRIDFRRRPRRAKRRDASMHSSK